MPETNPTRLRTQPRTDDAQAVNPTSVTHAVWRENGAGRGGGSPPRPRLLGDGAPPRPPVAGEWGRGRLAGPPPGARTTRARAEEGNRGRKGDIWGQADGLGMTGVSQSYFPRLKPGAQLTKSLRDSGTPGLRAGGRNETKPELCPFGRQTIIPAPGIAAVVPTGSTRLL